VKTRVGRQPPRNPNFISFLPFFLGRAGGGGAAGARARLGRRQASDRHSMVTRKAGASFLLSFALLPLSIALYTRAVAAMDGRRR